MRWGALARSVLAGPGVTAALFLGPADRLAHSGCASVALTFTCVGQPPALVSLLHVVWVMSGMWPPRGTEPPGAGLDDSAASAWVSGSSQAL